MWKFENKNTMDACEKFSCESKLIMGKRSIENVL